MALRVDVLTIFPESFKPVVDESILKRAQKAGKLKICLHDIRDFTTDKHRKVDDRPFGGGPGMVMCAQPIISALEHVKKISRVKKTQRKIVLLSPRGRVFSQKKAFQLSRLKQLILICGHYEGVDERVKYFIDQELSIGDYVLTGGELAAMVVIDAVARLVPGVLGREASLDEESFKENMLEYPHFTRPAVFKGKRVPEVLLSGDHEAIKNWRRDKAIEETKKSRPDLFKSKELEARSKRKNH